MLLAVWCFTAAVASMLVVGTAVRGVLARGRALDEMAWVQVPFVGIAFTVLVLQFQLYLNVPIKHGVVALWALSALGGCLWLYKGQVRASLRAVPVLAGLACVAVLAVQGYGVAKVGPRDYVGRSWSDQFNYTAEAEFFRSEGFDLDYQHLGQRAWLVRVVTLRHHRIGQSVLHAYHGVLSRMDTRSQFMPTIVLSCILIVLALYAAGRRLGLHCGAAALAGLLGGLVPGVTLLVQESFLSHALGIPLLLMLPVLLHSYTVERAGSALGTAFLCLGGLASIYTEFLAFELLLVTAFLVLALTQRPRGLCHCLGYVVLLAAPWLCNPLYREINTFLRLTTLGMPVLGHIYPWAYGEICPAVLWVGDFCVKPAESAYHQPAIWLGWAVILGGAAGLGGLAANSVVCWWRRGRQSADNTAGLALALLGLALVPALMLLMGRDRPYQFVKLLITVCPLCALGLVLLTNRLSRAFSSSGGAWPGIVRLPLLLVTAVAGTGSALMVVQSTDPEEPGWRTHQVVALSRDFRQLRRHLEPMRGWDLLVRPSSNDLGYQQIWTLYFARYNRVWMAWPMHNDGWKLHSDASVNNLVDLEGLPDRFGVLCPRDSAYLQPPKNLPPQAIVWQTSGYLLWQYDGRPWACVTDIDNPNGNESDDHWYWLGGGETVVRLFATESGVVHLHLGIGSGPCIDPAEKIGLIVKDNQGSEALVEMAAGQLVLPVPVHKGMTAVTLRPLNAKRHSAGVDPRPLLAQLRVERLEFRPQPAGAMWACLGCVDNPNRFEDDAQQRIWLGGGDTILHVWASSSGVARLEVDVVRGPCLDRAESPVFQIVTNQGPTQVVALPPGRQMLEVSVVKGLNTIRVRPVNETHGSTGGDPRMLMAQWSLGDISLRPASPLPAAGSLHGN